MINQISFQKHLYAIIIPHDFHQSGVNFCTPNDFSQQLAYIHHHKGHEIPAHVHNPVKRSVSYTLETLLVKSGKIRIDFYTQGREYFQSVELTAGDVILLAAGGHGITILEETELIEIKQGPYAGDQDKTRFEGVKKSRIKLKVK